MTSSSAAGITPTACPTNCSTRPPDLSARRRRKCGTKDARNGPKCAEGGRHGAGPFESGAVCPGIWSAGAAIITGHSLPIVGRIREVAGNRKRLAWSAGPACWAASLQGQCADCSRRPITAVLLRQRVADPLCPEYESGRFHREGGGLEPRGLEPLSRVSERYASQGGTRSTKVQWRRMPRRRCRCTRAHV